MAIDPKKRKHSILPVMAPRDVTTVRPKAGAHRPTDDIDFSDPGNIPEIERMTGSAPWETTEAEAPPAEVTAQRPATSGADDESSAEEAAEIKKFNDDIEKRFPKKRKQSKADDAAHRFRLNGAGIVR